MATRVADSLTEYRRKRDFAKTAEPSGKVARKKGYSYLIQKHAATRLHYDFRLELDGVLLSWAVTRGPSLNPSEKRLAVHVEDHPLDYGGFEGTIPKGEYGGGSVMLWDRGTWEPLDDPRAGLKKGRLHFRLHGERLQGGWALIRMPPRGREKRENWLLIKERDEFADESDPLLEKFAVSVKSGRTMDEIASGDSKVWRSNKAARGSAESAARTRRAQARSLSLPKFLPPQLATLVDEVPAGPDWVHEFKYDGYRLLIAANGPSVKCYTRSGQDWTDKFQPIADAIAAMDLPGVLLDGEAVSFTADGRTDFSTLQHALSESGAIDFFAFDMLEEGGKDITRLPLAERKERLQALFDDLPKNSLIHFSTHIEGDGAKVLKEICVAGHEGIVSKKASAPYRGGRSKTWLKIKCSRRQEFVIGGWMPSDKRNGFRSLLLGTWKDGKLVYNGRVGTGFDEHDLGELSARFARLERKDSPFGDVPRETRRGVKWIEPKLVAEIAFTEFTSDGILRHPSFLGLREDKQAKEVKREEPEPVERAMGDGAAEIVKAGIRITHPGRVVFPGQGVTKRDLAEYYEAAADLMLPHIARRPLSLVRCPGGSSGHCFFQKHDSGGFPAAMHHVAIAESSGEKAEYFYVDDLAGIIGAVQMNTLEFHIWGSHIEQVERPDRIVFDLDPDIGLNFEDVRRAAFDMRDRLKQIGLTTFPMLSGGKGFHVVAPLTRRAEWPEVKAFCKGFADLLGLEAPERYVSNMAKAKRKGRIFVDYLRNERGSTAICPYSTRSRERAPVAAPITWEEAKTVGGANVFTVQNMAERMRKVGDPWPDYFKVRQSITKALMKAVNAG